MKSFLIIVASFAPLICAAENTASPAITPPSYMSGSLCTRPDQIVFSCSLAKTSKVVSVCAAGGATPHRFYYVFGKPHTLEVTYSANEKTPSKAFEYAHLFFPGATGGYAYSFVRQEYKYILYSISGTGFDSAGVLVQRRGELRAISDLKCKTGSLKENNDNDLQREIDTWDHDRNLELHGLPHIPRN